MKRLALVLTVSAVGLPIAACGGQKAEAPRTVTETKSAARPETLPSDQLSSLDARDADLQNAIEKFQDSLSACASGSESAISACFAEKYRPYGRALEAVRDETNAAQEAASGTCASLLEKAETELIELDSVSDDLRVSFSVGDYGSASVDKFGSAFNRYRDAMDEALTGCSS